MIELLDKIDLLEQELEIEKFISSSLRQDLDLADEIHFDELRAADRFNNILTCLVIVLALLAVTG